MPDYKWTVRLDMGPFMGDESDRLIWHFLSDASTVDQAIATMRSAYPRASSISAFPKMFG